MRVGNLCNFILAKKYPRGVGDFLGILQNRESRYKLKRDNLIYIYICFILRMGNSLILRFFKRNVFSSVRLNKQGDYE